MDPAVTVESVVTVRVDTAAASRTRRVLLPETPAPSCKHHFSQRILTSTNIQLAVVDSVVDVLLPLSSKKLALFSLFWDLARGGSSFVESLDHLGGCPSVGTNVRIKKTMNLRSYFI